MEEFKYSLFRELTREELISRLDKLETHLRGLLPLSSHEEFFNGSQKIIELLQAHGYELYMQDYNGTDLEVWGGDYTKPESACELIVNFDLNKGITLEWSNWLYEAK